jgi:hypothetical protein
MVEAYRMRDADQTSRVAAVWQFVRGHRSSLNHRATIFA